MLRIVFLLLLPINKIGLGYNISPGNVFCLGWQLWIFIFFVEITLEADVTNFVDSGWGGCTESVEKTKHVFWKSWMIFWWLHNIFFKLFIKWRDETSTRIEQQYSLACLTLHKCVLIEKTTKKQKSKTKSTFTKQQAAQRTNWQWGKWTRSSPAKT